MVINMEQIEDKQLEKINGGGVSAVWIGIGIAAIMVFISGVIEGIAYPRSCTE